MVRQDASPPNSQFSILNMETTPDKSKIGRLSVKFRNQICQKIFEGVPAKEICREINASKEYKALQKDYGWGAVNEQNVSDYRRGGYKRWLIDHKKTERLARLTEHSYQIALATGGDPAAVGARILTGKLIDLIECSDEENAIELAKAISSLRKGENDAARLELDRDKATLAKDALELERA